MTAQPRALVDQIAIWNALVAGFGAEIALPGSAAAQLSAGSRGNSPAGQHFTVQTAQGALGVTVVDYPFAAVSGAQVALADIPDLPAPLPQILTEGLRDMLLSMLPEGLRAQVISAEPGAPTLPADAECIEVTAMARGWPEPARFVVQAPMSVFTGLAAAPGDGAPVPSLPQALAEIITVPVRVALRGREIPLRVLRSLEPGDILLPPAQGQPFLLLGGSLVAGLTRDAETWTITELAVTDQNDLPDGPLETATDPAGAGGPAMAEAASLEDIPVSLAFVVDTQTLPLSELQSLRPGAALPFAVADPAAGIEVQVLANGRAIGAGTIVEIDGRHAVRLSRLFGQS